METEELFIRIGGVKLFVKKIIPFTGDEKPAIIMLHDALGSVGQWKDFPELIAQQFSCPVIVYDRAGHGKSGNGGNGLQPEFFETEAFTVLPELIEKLNLRCLPVLLGHSDGGTIALMYGSRYSVKGIIVIAAHVLLEEKTVLGVVETGNKKDYIVEKLRPYHGDKADLLFRNWFDLWSGSMMKAWNIIPLLPGIRDSVLVIQGKNDRYATDSQAQIITDHTGGSSLLFLVDDCDHFPHREQPKAVVGQIRIFFDTFNLLTVKTTCSPAGLSGLE